MVRRQFFLMGFLVRFARNPSDAHLKAWETFNQGIGAAVLTIQVMWKSPPKT
ncbi:hypothetical protein [Nostoc sp.]|uniref:hypothetical protein n=1 Tax=Nostoc sp. TaxID=1180 RepID=UPI002FF8B9F1